MLFKKAASAYSTFLSCAKSEDAANNCFQVVPQLLLLIAYQMQRLLLRQLQMGKLLDLHVDVADQLARHLPNESEIVLGRRPMPTMRIMKPPRTTKKIVEQFCYNLTLFGEINPLCRLLPSKNQDYSEKNGCRLFASEKIHVKRLWGDIITQNGNNQ